MNDQPDRDVVVFTEALRLPEGERAGYLDRACEGDHQLRGRVEALLRANERAGNFLGSPAAGVPVAKESEVVAGEKPGDRIGRYKLLQQIGEGGGGVVFLAEQEEPVRRRVALKVVKPGMDTRSVIARFEAERQALALMDHPNIAHVFDAGATDSGRPFFVMELVRGMKITEYCDQHSLTTEARLELFTQVCLAVQHAHQKGVIHRDIKPSNILVTTAEDGRALPKVIDFGIAKATTGQRLTDKTLFTAFEMLIGTPSYMSPEQAALASVDVDTRTDIYSLGVLLYELLTGSTPFDTRELLKTGLDEVRRVIREQEPVRPSTRLGTLGKGALTTVARDRQSEPPTLIHSIRGDLDWIVMKALEKDRTRRYETANGLALDVQRFLADEVVSARPPSTLYKLRKLIARNRLLFAAIGVIALLLVISLVVVSTSLAKEREARLEAEADKLKSRQVTQFLEDMLRGVGPSVARGRDTTILKEILAATAERVGSELTNQPAVVAELHSLLGQIYHKLGAADQAEKLHQAALALNRDLFGPESHQAAAALNDLGEALSKVGRLADAEGSHREALAIRRKLFGNMHPDVAASLNNLANVFRLQHRFAEGETLTREALAIRRALFGEDSLEAAESLRNLSILLADQGRSTESEEMAREVLATRKGRLGNEDALVAESLDDLAWMTGNNGKSVEAEGLEMQSLVMKRNVLGDEHSDVARSLFLLGQRLHQRGNLVDSAAMLSAALSIQRKLLGNKNPDTLYTLRNLSWVLEREGKFAEAEMGNRASLAAWREVYGNESAQAVSASVDLSRVLVAQEKFAEAEQLLGEQLTPEFVQRPSSAVLLIQRMDLLARRGRWREAVVDAALVHAYQPDEHYRIHSLAPLLVMTRDRTAYEQLCRRIQSDYPTTLNPYIAERMSKDCLLLPDPGVNLQWADAMADIAVNRGRGDPSMPFFQAAKALSSYRLGRLAEAVEWAENALNSAATYEQAHAHAYGILAMAQWRLGEKNQARASLAKGEQLVPPIGQGGDNEDLGGGWVAWLVARISLDEASALIQPAARLNGTDTNP